MSSRRTERVCRLSHLGASLCRACSRTVFGGSGGMCFPRLPEAATIGAMTDSRSCRRAEHRLALLTILPALRVYCLSRWIGGLLRACRPLAMPVIVVVAAQLSWGASAANAAATLQVSVNADPVVGQATSITASGSADEASTSDQIWVYLDSSGTCGASAYSESARNSSFVLIDSYVTQGAFSQSASWTPTDTTRIEACGYVSSSDAATPDAFIAAPINPRLPRASVSVAPPPNVDTAAGFTIRVAGSAEVGGLLSVYLEPFGNYCSSTPGDEANTGGQAVLTDSDVGPGSFSDSLDVNPPYPISVRLCAYVTGRGGSPVYANGESFLRVRPTAGVIGGKGTVTPAGRVGSLHMNRSTVDDVLKFAGVPDVLNDDLNSNAGITSNYTQIAYGCNASGSNCQTEYDINQDTGALADFTTSSRRFATSRGSRVGMRTADAVHREHHRAQSGCFTGIFEQRGGITLLVEVIGGRPAGRGSIWWTGGRVGYLFTSSNRNDVLGC